MKGGGSHEKGTGEGKLTSWKLILIIKRKGEGISGYRVALNFFWVPVKNTNTKKCMYIHLQSGGGCFYGLDIN